MNYDREILFILNEAGPKGLSIRKITMHVFNKCNGLFDVISLEDVHRYVASYLIKNSKAAGSVIERTGIRGVYRLNLENTSNQLQFDFKDDVIGEKNCVKAEDDMSLSLF